ncbi:MAG: thermonuclease family protein, partial [Planctomycetota bacterium]
MLSTLLLIGPLVAASVPTGPQQRAHDPNAYPKEASYVDVLRDCAVGAPEELFDVLRVVDGDTLWIEREGERVKLRLLSIDTEEKWMEGGGVSASKPSTRYGDQTTGWAQGFFTPRSPDAGPIRVGLRFPDGVERYDPYGRLLCHVVTDIGIDFNLLCVRMGFSPYFNKYGNSRIDHAAFVDAEKKARAEKRGVWNPGTNSGGKQRDYTRLKPWWDARAAAVDAFRA